ncbi:putative blue pigment (indigoidine) exporter [Chromohalobacter marismortui]|uniref:Putative blue pigment (Indigoidine) exporter n=1 Tax=Chromohalobacter marismortui TaxID=42055 RepID=A0A4R7NTU0_9GAMM|nr:MULTISPECIES: EamA family transporter [Chromohalobacter]MCI0509068.1 EamA family transporter [Chromohalobacter sp.]MCI0592827.1 EamA family transporter [Chromohalobacter sp.]TDU24041.1 putative blue pigment (indigoidine) exporter [Chromohalobacter marismortui]
MDRHNIVLNIFLTSLVPIVWGSTYLVTTEFLPPDAPLLAAVLRALPAGLILIAFGRQLPTGGWWVRAALLGVLNIGAFFYFLFVAAYHLPGGVAALIMSIQPIIVLLYGVVLFGNAITATQVLACVLAAVGVALVVLRPEAELNVVGVTAGLGGALSMATGIVLTKRWGRPAGTSLLTFTGWQLAFGGAALLPIALVYEGLPPVLTVRNWLGLGYLGLFGALAAYALWFRGIERLPALSVSFISLLSPLSATLLGYWFLNEQLNWLQLLGGVGVLGAVFLAQPNINLFARFQRPRHGEA